MAGVKRLYPSSTERFLGQSYSHKVRIKFLKSQTFAQLTKMGGSHISNKAFVFSLFFSLFLQPIRMTRCTKVVAGQADEGGRLCLVVPKVLWGQVGLFCWAIENVAFRVLLLLTVKTFFGGVFGRVDTM